jgi:hypothetical protein
MDSGRRSIESILTASNASDLAPTVLITDARNQIVRVKGVICIDDVQADRVLSALLDHAVDEDGRVKTALAIRACVGECRDDSEATKTRLVGLAKAYVEHLLWPCMCILCQYA